MNLIVVNDFININGGTTQVVHHSLKYLSEYPEIDKIHYLVGSNELEGPVKYSDKISIYSTAQKELIKESNLLKGLTRGFVNRKAKQIINNNFGHLDRSKTIVYIHGYMKILSPYVIDSFAKLGFQCVLVIHDFFIYCPNGAYYNFKSLSHCNIKPLSAKCLINNCDSRNYAYKLFRVIRSLFQKRILKRNSKQLSYMFVSKILHDAINRDNNFFNKSFILENAPFNTPIKKVEVSKNSYFLYIGRFSPEKGYDLLINWAFELPDVKFILVGGGKSNISQLPRNVEIKEWQNQVQLDAIYAKARCVIIPSRWVEPFGLITIEAASRGIPLLISKNSGSISYVRDRIDGYHIDITDFSDTAKKIEQLNIDDKLIESFGESFYNSYKNKYGQLEDYFKRMLDQSYKILESSKTEQ